jgi:hypothetical protein
VKYLFFFLVLTCNLAWGQLINTVELTEKFSVTNEDAAKKELLHLATLKSLEKFLPEMGYKNEEFNEKLQTQFNDYFSKYKESKLIEKFGSNYKTILSEEEKKAFIASLETEKHNLFIRFSRTNELLRSHSFVLIKQDEKEPTRWNAKVNLDIDKIKLDKFLRKTVMGETKAFFKIILISEIDPHGFSWSDLGLDNEKIFLKPLNDSWLKWIDDNLPSTVEEVVVCDSECLTFYNKWSENESNAIVIPEEYGHSVFLKVNILLKRIEMVENLQESTFDWEGRTILHDVGTKRILASFPLPQEKRTFRQLDQKAVNSGLASSLYRSPLTAFMQFNRKLEEKIGFNRVSKLVIKGFRNLDEVHLLMEKLKTRGSSLGLDVSLDNFSKDEANLLCFYRGEEKSFTDLLSGLKELKSTHSYTLVNEFTGVHHVIKFVTE